MSRYIPATALSVFFIWSVWLFRQMPRHDPRCSWWVNSTLNWMIGLVALAVLPIVVLLRPKAGSPIETFSILLAFTTVATAMAVLHRMGAHSARSAWADKEEAVDERIDELNERIRRQSSELDSLNGELKEERSISARLDIDLRDAKAEAKRNRSVQ